MSQIVATDSKERLILTVNGEFTFAVNREFRDAYKTAASKPLYQVDLTRATYMDSAGLGMLLQLREFAGGDRRRVKLLCRSGAIIDIFKVANFDQLFDIETVN